MTRILKWGTVVFMAVSIFGWIGWLWFTAHTPAHWLKNIIGLGYGCAFGCAIIHWIQDLKNYAKWKVQDNEWTQLQEIFKELLETPPPPRHFRCPDCGIISHNPNDLKNQFCGFCCEFKGDRFR